MQEVPLSDQAQALAFGARLLAGECDVLVLLTGVGARMLVDALSGEFGREQVLAALSRTSLVCRGPKPAAILKGLGLKPAAVAPEPNTFVELLPTLDGDLPVSGKRVWVQEYGKTSEELLAALRARGAQVCTVAVYGWKLPDDTAPLQAAIRELALGQADAVVFTSAQQVRNLLQVAAQQGLEGELRQALGARVLVASVGPVTSAALQQAGLEVDLEPARPKMGPLAIALMRTGPGLLAQKRQGHTP